MGEEKGTVECRERRTFEKRALRVVTTAYTVVLLTDHIVALTPSF